jgi:transcription termination/antitermination protein NusG
MGKQKTQVEEKSKEVKKEVKAAKKVAVEETATQAPVVDQPEKDTSKMKWFVLNTYSGHENKVTSLIQQRMENAGLSDLLGQVLVPTQSKIVLKDGQKKTVEERILPGYVLIQMVLNDQTWPLVRDTAGVSGFAGTDRKPTPIQPEVLTKFIKSQSSSSYKITLTVNDSVVITDGNFKDFSGIVTAFDEDKGKVTVMLSLFGREVPVECNLMQVKKL